MREVRRGAEEQEGAAEVGAPDALERRPAGAEIVRADPWTALRRHTAARIALGRTGASLPTQEVLAFGLAHARARDAVHLPLDVSALRTTLVAEGFEVLDVASRAPDRAAYLARPDWGRRLTDAAVQRLAAASHDVDAESDTVFDVVFVVADGLSSTAVQRHAAPLLVALRAQLDGWSIAPVVIATQARVALADEVGECLRARIAVSLIGERPGLSSPDSLGAYLTYGPRVGLTDEARNCISNIRPEGLPIAAAAALIAAHLRAARQARLTGVALRFDASRALPDADA